MKIFHNKTKEAFVEEISDKIRDVMTGLHGFGEVVDVVRESEVERTFSRLTWLKILFHGGHKTVVVKTPKGFYRDDDVITRKYREIYEWEYNASRDLLKKFEGVEGFKAVRAIGFFPDVPALVTEEIKGCNLGEIILKKGRWYPDGVTRKELETICVAAGRSLKILQTRTKHPTQKLSIEEMARYVDQRLIKLNEGKISNVDQALRKKVLRKFERAHREIPPSDLAMATAHGDFSPSNIMYTGSEIVMIDLSRYRTASIFYDLTRLCHQLSMYAIKPSFRDVLISSLKEAVMKGYDVDLGTNSYLFKLYTIQHLLCHWSGHVYQGDISFKERLYNRWVCHRHRSELEYLLA